MRLLGQFLIWIFQQPGYAVRGGELLRSLLQAQANAASGVGITNSLHRLGLAIDLSFMLNGVYQTDSEVYQPLGEYWKSLHPLCRWGGDFSPRRDGNHFSIEHEGVK